ncbi:methionyl-tRNA formyltransferase [Pseudocolwellia agarivorans]|uniref:methionyl-tRNA formyltransferase n=1 Tax=Pseudocolwellia agarivorans TaxID=1911682 RepID=UPI0009843AE9|nr:methionyl-tRNA formyltransferase [Pseudocolwellia agarivorans]
MSKALNIIFAGTPDFAAQHLKALIDSEHNVVAVYCPPDKPAGRGKKMMACATKLLALEHNLPVEQPINFKDTVDQQHLATYNADIMVVVAYGLLLPEVILETPRLGCINVHGSILPKWRGAAPIQRSLEAGDSKTGVTIMQMDKGLDTGDMISTATCEITTKDTSASLYEKLAIAGPKALTDALTLMSTSAYTREPQNHELSTYAAKLDKAEAELNWNENALVLHRKIRAYIPWPVAQFTYIESKSKKEHRIRIWQASIIETQSNATAGTIMSVDKNGILVATGTADQAIQLETLQIPGKKALPVSDIINARADWFVVGQPITGIASINQGAQ